MGLDNGVRLTWVGHATWILETPGGKRVLIDPWVTGNPVVPEHLNDPGPADVFLLTHGHSDHIGDVAHLADRHAPKAVLCIAELGVYLEGQGVQNVIGFNKGGTVEVEGIRFTMVGDSLQVVVCRDVLLQPRLRLAILLERGLDDAEVRE